MEPLPDDSEEVFVFEDEVVGGRIPKEYIPSVEKGFRNALNKGPLAEFPIVGVKAILKDGSYHEVDSSDMAFQICGWGCFRETFLNMKPTLLEPVMKVEIEAPADFQGPIVGDLISRRGMIGSTEIIDNVVTILGEVPLAETFGYSTDLRSLTQGQGTFTMEPSAYRRVPKSIQEDILTEKKKGQKGQLVGAK
jgi:elongation factor G